VSLPPAASMRQVHDDLRGAIASRFSCAKAGFVLRDVEAGGSIVPVSPTLTGSFKLEVPRADTGAAGPAPPPAPARGPGIPAAAAAVAEGGRPPAMGSIQMHFTMEPPHGPAVWLHAKLTSAGGVANSCRAHVLAPPPRIRMRGGEPSAHGELLGRVCFALCDAAGAPVPSRVLHPGEPVITRVTAEGRQQQQEGEDEEEVWEASWPRMAITDTSRCASRCGRAEQKLTAAELQAPRGASGWFSLRAFVPPAAPGATAAAGGAPPIQDLWLRDGALHPALVCVPAGCAPARCASCGGGARLPCTDDDERFVARRSDRAEGTHRGQERAQRGAVVAEEQGRAVRRPQPVRCAWVARRCQRPAPVPAWQVHAVRPTAEVHQSRSRRRFVIVGGAGPSSLSRTQS
jgi:hypothetical protein